MPVIESECLFPDPQATTASATRLARIGFSVELDQIRSLRLPVDDSGGAASVGLAMQSQVKVEIHVASELEEPAARCADTDRPVHALLTCHRASVRRLRPMSTLTKKLPRAGHQPDAPGTERSG